MAPGDPQRRTIPAREVVAMLALYGWALEDDRGGAAPAALLDRLVTAGLPFALAGDGTRRFDPAEAINHVVAAGLAGREQAWRARFVATGQGLARSVPPTAARFTVRFERRFHPGGDHRDRLRLTLPFPVATGMVRDLAVSIDVPDGIVADTAPGRLSLRLSPPFPGCVTAGWTARCLSDPAGDAGEAGAPDDATYLAADEGIVQVTPMVRRLAADLAGHLADDGAAVRAFCDHLLDAFACGVIDYAAIRGAATDHVLHSGWYDCRLGAALLVALCRARDIPARIVAGCLLWPAAPAWHGWCEVRLAGRWRAWDPIAWDLSAGGRDAGWRDGFAGAVGHRLTTEIWPHAFPGGSSFPVPPAHHRLSRRHERGVEILVTTLDGRPIHRDRISVTLG